MKLDIKNVKNGDTIAIFTTWDEVKSNAFLMKNITIEECHTGIYEIIDETGYAYTFDEESDYCFSTLEEAIDCLRKIDYISNFNDTTITYYLPYLKEAIDKRYKLYGIRRNKENNSKQIISYRIIGVKYEDGNYGNWKIKLETEGNISSIPYAKLYYNANSLGKTLFFSYDNAIKRLNK